MKKLMFLFVSVGALMLASCETAGKKSEGTYSGTHNVTGFGPQTGTVVVTSTADQVVNINLNCPAATMNTNATAVSATLSNSTVAYSFTGSGTTNYDVTALSGALNDKSLTLSYTIYYGGFGVAGSFTGTKP
jgi:hypothetical protein